MNFYGILSYLSLFQGVPLFCPVIPAFSRSCGKICISKVILHSTNKMILKWIATVVSVFSTIKVILFSISKVILLNIKNTATFPVCRFLYLFHRLAWNQGENGKGKEYHTGDTT